MAARNFFFFFFFSHFSLNMFYYYYFDCRIMSHCQNFSLQFCLEIHCSPFVLYSSSLSCELPPELIINNVMARLFIWSTAKGRQTFPCIWKSAAVRSIWLWRSWTLLHWKLSNWQGLISDVKHSNVEVNTAPKDCDCFTHWPVVWHLFFAEEVFVSPSQEGRPYLAFVCLISWPVMFARPQLCCRARTWAQTLER